MCSALTGTAHPPLPLQLFLPAQPASPDLQPPMPLQAFLPAHSCLASLAAHPPLPLHSFLPEQAFLSDLQPPLPLHSLWPLQMWVSAFFSSAFFSWGFANRVEPAAMPATTAPIAFVNSLRSMLFSLASWSLAKKPRPGDQHSGFLSGAVVIPLFSSCVKRLRLWPGRGPHECYASAPRHGWFFPRGRDRPECPAHSWGLLECWRKHK